MMGSGRGTGEDAARAAAEIRHALPSPGGRQSERGARDSRQHHGQLGPRHASVSLRWRVHRRVRLGKRSGRHGNGARRVGRRRNPGHGGRYRARAGRAVLGVQQKVRLVSPEPSPASAPAPAREDVFLRPAVDRGATIAVSKCRPSFASSRNGPSPSRCSRTTATTRRSRYSCAGRRTDVRGSRRHGGRTPRGPAKPVRRVSAAGSESCRSRNCVSVPHHTRGASIASFPPA